VTNLAREWLTVDQAAAELGLSPSGFRGLAKTEHLTIRRRGRQPGVWRADLDAYLERARIQPGQMTALSRDHRRSARFGAHEPYARTIDAHVPGLGEANVLRDELGWTDADIADLLGIHYSNVSRRRINGFSAEQVTKMRQLADTSRHPSEIP